MRCSATVEAGVPGRPAPVRSTSDAAVAGAQPSHGHRACEPADVEPDPTVSAAAANKPRRAAWPTLTYTLLALLGVLGVLLLTGSGNGTGARFGVRASPAEISLTAGDSAPVIVTLSAEHGFDATVTLSTTSLPPGVQLELDRRTVAVSADGQPVDVSGELRTSSTAAASTVGIEVVGRAGKATESSLIELHIQPASITDPASPPAPVVSGVDRASFTVSGNPRGMLRPGGALPIDLRLTNANPFELNVQNLAVSVAATSKPACAANNFVVLPYRGGYPLLVPAGTSSTLASLHVPASRWPQLRMRNLPPAKACIGATVRLRYAGSGSGI